MTRRARGRSLDHREALYVGTRNCTEHVAGVRHQMAIVKAALETEAMAVPITPVLCFVNAEWKLLARPFRVGDVIVAWPKAVTRMVSHSGTLDTAAIERIVACLQGRLHPA